ncbi:hypothetical protein KVR01_000097 [Diaporthe batatas]|uniref:uncharacterized protein n=1 Tax=Diaporthe batatas TaxID=748121 RepID=UPI001D046444|nr:uncharacterized protein KVR01_000097 [Diaporthe batatas]KAG8169352.1 hypothetical protein KVR01_000097 [Diaporthe batatas]
MSLNASGSLLSSLAGFFCAEAAFVALFSRVILSTAPRSTGKRAAGLIALCATTAWMEKLIVPIFLENERPHWAATVASLLWVQFLSASDLVLVIRVHAAQLANLSKSSSSMLRGLKTAAGILLNVRRIGTHWQVKNIPSSAGLKTQSRSGFVARRVAVTLVAYLFVDAVVSMPPPEQHLVRADKAALFSLRKLGVDDIAFRSGTVVGYWLCTCILNLFMNNVGAVVAVLLGLSSPTDWPPLYGPFSEAYTIRRFWGYVPLDM